VQTEHIFAIFHPLIVLDPNIERRGYFVREIGLSCLVVALVAGGVFGSAAAYAGDLPKRFEFGRIALGAPVNKVPRWAVKSDCRHAHFGLGACGFYDPDGIAYSIFDYAVCEKKIYVNAKTKGKLPYGIRFENSKSEIIAGLSKRLKLKFTATDSRTVESNNLAPESFDGSAIILGFDKNGKVASIKLWSNCT
jgi:hypothetical protein